MLISSYRVSNKPLIHPEFKQALSQLPKQYNPQFKPRFYKLIDTFGTHYITKVTDARCCRKVFRKMLNSVCHHALHEKHQKGERVLTRVFNIMKSSINPNSFKSEKSVFILPLMKILYKTFHPLIVISEELSILMNLPFSLFCLSHSFNLTHIHV